MPARRVTIKTIIFTHVTMNKFAGAKPLKIHHDDVYRKRNLLSGSFLKVSDTDTN